MCDAFKQKTMKDFWWGVSVGDGWNAWGYGHTKRRTLGRKKINRAARHRLKAELHRDYKKETAWTIS